MPAITITKDEIHEAIAAAARGNAPEDARTVQELVASSGIDIRRVRDALRSLQRAGRLVVHKVRRDGLDGRLAVVPAYTILPATKPR